MAGINSISKLDITISCISYAYLRILEAVILIYEIKTAFYSPISCILRECELLQHIMLTEIRVYDYLISENQLLITIFTHLLIKDTNSHSITFEVEFLLGIV